MDRTRGLSPGATDEQHVRCNVIQADAIIILACQLFIDGRLPGLGGLAERWVAEDSFC